MKQSNLLSCYWKVWLFPTPCENSNHWKSPQNCRFHGSNSNILRISQNEVLSFVLPYNAPPSVSDVPYSLLRMTALGKLQWPWTYELILHNTCHPAYRYIPNMFKPPGPCSQLLCDPCHHSQKHSSQEGMCGLEVLFPEILLLNSQEWPDKSQEMGKGRAVWEGRFPEL